MAVKKKATKKKTVKKKVAKKKVVRTSAPKTKKASVKPVANKTPARKVVGMRATSGKFRRVLKNLVLFVILALISFLLYGVSGEQMYRDFFSLLTWILSFIAVAFLILLLVLLFLKVLRK